MKNLYHTLILFSLITVTGFKGKSQILNENFNLGMPLNWNQSPPGSWSYSSNLGTGGSGCFYAYEANSNSITVNVATPTLNLNAVTNLTVSFQFASVANNFVGPDLALYYDAGAGPQFLARWGSGFNTTTTYTITYGSDYVPPLDSININWYACTHAISSISGAAVKFIFEAELVNGGYAVLDNIVISGIVPTNTTGIANNSENQTITVFPNPTPDKYIFIKGENIKKVFIDDNLGKHLNFNYTFNQEGFELDLKDFARGIYYISIVKEGDGLIYKKIILE
ncbi:T9SS type A sorting domain-containing protein [Aurantibacillus circumpalustris]|uniref:T9SS type A sorting domain-containing protein n=1 Tax=Aurantibacillus circumpalustris TaxID=3036359 RepID=UPI00295B7858|nr:T9SS type A sorting domain-containing protein [Aurantibacillus circumpalustris]